MLMLDDHKALIEQDHRHGRASSLRLTALAIGFMIFTMDERERLEIAEADPACFASDGSRNKLAKQNARTVPQDRNCPLCHSAAEEELARHMPAPPAPLRDPLAVARAMGAMQGPRDEVVVIQVCDRQATSLHVLAIARDPSTGRVSDLTTLDVKRRDEDGGGPLHQPARRHGSLTFTDLGPEPPD